MYTLLVKDEEVRGVVTNCLTTYPMFKDSHVQCLTTTQNGIDSCHSAQYDTGRSNKGENI